MAAESENPFWDFSLAVYNRPGVAEACLALQDRRGLDVNLLLFCCWAGSVGRPLGPRDIARLRGAVDDWQQGIVGPLRAVRRRLKGLSDVAAGEGGALRQAVKDCELEAERIEQAMLHAALAGLSTEPSEPADPAACGAANLTAYLQAASLEADPADRQDLEAILRGAFDGLAPEDAKRLLWRQI
ncbi:MAG: TIGR02444 family protein [Kiloniellales bacterium]|nr:TIGR02444 family protein [Kiloniellales bacterium]